MQGGKSDMFMRNSIIAALLISGANTALAQESLFGEPATQDDIDKRFWSVFPDGENLPDGEGTAIQGAILYEEQCELCHGTPGRKRNE